MQHAAASVGMAPDETLVERARGGDAPAREELFRRHFGVSYRVARRLLGHDQDALDAVQDGFLKALRRLDDFDGRSGFRTWLLRVVTNAALDLGRRKRRRPATSLDDRPGELAVVNGDEPDKGLQGEDLRRILDSAMARLSPRLRATFVLFAEAGLSYREIADLQNVPMGTVMSRLNAARRKLQSFLGDAEIFSA
jgi:RNA polymerase sigma-70 factor (ECF subfamily)